MRRSCICSWSGTWAILLAVYLSAGVTERVWGTEAQTLSLDQCIAMALERNHTRPASRFAVAAAERGARRPIGG